MKEFLALIVMHWLLSLLGLLVVAGVVYGAIRKFRQAARASKPFEGLAKRLGLTYNGGGLGWLGRLKLVSEYRYILACIQDQIQTRHKRRKRSASFPLPANILEGVFEGCRVCAFQLGQAAGSIGSVFILEHERSFPELRIYPEQKGLLGAESRTDIDLDSVEFTNAFVVKSPDKRFAYDICHARMMAYLLEHPDSFLVFKKNCFLLWFPGPLRPEDVEPRLRRLVTIRGLIPEYREGVETETTRSRAVAETARRLRMRLRRWDPTIDNPFRSLKQFQIILDRNWLHILEAAYQDRTYHILDYLPVRADLLEDAPPLNRAFDIAPVDARGFTYFTCELPQPCPALAICPESAVTFKLFARDVQFGGNPVAARFSDTFVVTCKDEPFARAFCHHGLMDYLLRHPELAIEIHERLLAISVGLFKALPTEQFGARLRQLEKIYQLIPGRLLLMKAPGGSRSAIVHEDQHEPPHPPDSEPPPLIL